MTGPMEGIKVLDLSIALTGPYAAALLADQGAEVIKVERPGIGDIGRWVGVMVNGMSALYLVCNRGKRGLAVDIHTDEGREIVLKEGRPAKAVIKGFAPTTDGVAVLGRASQKQVVNVAQRGGICAVLVGHPPGRLHGPDMPPPP